jgi:disulfide oxidoreductase YuzD
MESRFGESASIRYYDTSRPETKSKHAAMLERIREQGLVYPVTVINGEPLYEGAVSYPAILRAVQTRLSDVC